MFPTKGFNAYRQHWEDQASFMDKPPWDGDKILKLTISTDFDDNLKELQFSNHSLKKENGKNTVRFSPFFSLTPSEPIFQPASSNKAAAPSGL